jgi:hypothetical protein
MLKCVVRWLKWLKSRLKSTGRIVAIRMAIEIAIGRTIALMMEAASTSETSVNFYQTARPNNPEDNRPHTRRRENLRSHNGSNSFAHA